MSITANTFSANSTGLDAPFLPVSTALSASDEAQDGRLAELNQALRTANDLLEEKNRRLAELYDTAQQFVDHVSHEFLAPLTVVKEFTAIIREELAGPINPEQREYLDIVSDRVEDLSLMITDMLDTSRLEAGLLSLIRRPARVADIVRNVQPVLQRRAASHRVSLEIEVDDALPDVFCDHEKIGRVIVNLVVSAVKFSREGDEVRVRARAEPEAAQVAISVTGPWAGIAPGDLESYFDRTDRLEGWRAELKGFGLGLDVAHELVALNLGDIGVISEPGQGDTFRFTLPTTQPEPLITRFLRRCDRFNRHAAAFSLVVASPVDGVDAMAAEQIDDFLHHLLRRGDLVLRSDCGTWLLGVCGHAGDVDKVLARIDRAWGEANRNPAALVLPRLSYAVKGSWPLHESHADIIAYFLEHYRAPALHV